MRKISYTKQLGVSISEDTWDRLLEITNKHEVSISSWVRNAIEKTLAPDEYYHRIESKISREGQDRLKRKKEIATPCHQR